MYHISAIQQKRKRDDNMTKTRYDCEVARISIRIARVVPETLFLRACGPSQIFKIKQNVQQKKSEIRDLFRIDLK